MVFAADKWEIGRRGLERDIEHTAKQIEYVYFSGNLRHFKNNYRLVQKYRTT